VLSEIVSTNLTQLNQVYVAINLAPSDTFFQQQYVRTNYLTLLFNLGSILYMLRSISNGLIFNLSRFSIDYSMIRKLYSKNKFPDDDNSPQPDYKLLNGSKTQTLFDNLDKRASFDYSWQ